MTTSVIDYIFRDLAISYLKRSDLGQVKPEDLLATGTQDEGTAKHSRTAAKPVKPAAETAAVKPAGKSHETRKDTREDPQRTARIKGYEGDPCPNCGSFTLVRNGTCMKCDTCGGTTGCS